MRHGTRWGYQSGCECQACRDANAAYHQDYRRRTAAPQPAITHTAGDEALAMVILDLHDQLAASQPWRAQAACRGEPTGVFYPSHHTGHAEAKAICADCPVTADCLAETLRHDGLFGIWGGKTQLGRRVMRRTTTP